MLIAKGQTARHRPPDGTDPGSDISLGFWVATEQHLLALPKTANRPCIIVWGMGEGSDARAHCCVWHSIVLDPTVQQIRHTKKNKTNGVALVRART